MAIQIKFGDQVIDGVSEWDDSIPSKVAEELFPRRHGAIVQPLAFLGSRTITLTAETQQATTAALNTYLDDLSRRLTELGRDKLYFYDNDDRYLNAIKRGLTKRRMAGRAPGLIAAYNIEFFCDDPFWYSGTPSQSSLEEPSASPHTFSVTNAGNAETPPTITIFADGADATDVKVTNATTGQFIRYTGTITDGDTLTINMDQFTVDNAGSNGLNSLASGSTFWPLIRGTNNIEYTGPTTVDIQLFWRSRWAS